MSSASHQDSAIVEEVIAALTGGGEGAARADLRQQMQRAAREFDARTADTFGRALLGRLTGEPGDVRALEAMLILGLAHPDLLERKRIPLVQEGRRLAVLLEKRGESERAQTLLELLCARAPDDRAVESELAGVMRRNGNLARLVERQLSRAEGAIREGRREEAVRWLREVLAVDPSRRDVARMIRDLRFEDGQRRATLRKRLRIAAVSLLLACALGGAVWREFDLDRKYDELPGAPQGDLAAMHARLEALDELIDGNPLWFGMYQAGRERSQLRSEVDRLDGARAEAERLAAAERARIEIVAEAERSKARLLAEQFQFNQALEHLQISLQNAPPDWQYRGQVERDILSIREWQGRAQGTVRAEQRQP